MFMDQAHYKHAPAVIQKHDYARDMKNIDGYIEGIIHAGFRPGGFEHIGGGQSTYEQLEDMHYGDHGKVKKKLGPVLEMLAAYIATDHFIYCFMAEDYLIHTEEVLSHITDPDEKAHAQHYVGYVREYLDWIKSGGYKTPQSRMNSQ